MVKNSQRVYAKKELAAPAARHGTAAAAAQQAERATPLDQPAMRPLGYAWHFTKGTVGGLFNGMAKAGSKGMGLGVGVGLLVCIGGGFSVAYLMMGAAGGLLAGSLAGSAWGGLTGGLKDVARAQRRHKYADELAEHKAASATRPAQGAAPAYDYTDTYAAKNRINNYNFARTQQQDRENDQDYSTYWQDREAGHAHGGWGRGM